ncbi:dipeptidase PepE [Leeuwenhoekiella marinoflava]|uniref:Dipeptidase E n=2 Tax=Leeuwenhoekiella marinoflava TaxID=988 RepID=A0A4Q0PID2_9FLAO|nr:dipeptidase PepE [Leeuwenhoekiella marinoflava]RXG26844.1 dipeptidase E [Leeuwenhoekiella marinoflava]SHF39187.1 dipeptidase E [Leeuwenhoekiella marinoflava DSM 3653]
MKNLILASTSTVHGGSYLDYLKPTLNEHFKAVERIIFIPYARPGGISHELYTSNAQKFFNALDIEVVGLHSFKDPVKALENAEGVFTGGGNTFLLVKQLYENKIIASLRDRLYQDMPYLGTSAGTNIAGVSMQTTNDMPIVYPPSFKTLGTVPFNINAHYLDPDPTSKHMGETRETRIKEFHQFNNVPVIGLREGSWIEVKKRTYTLRGPHSARIFEATKLPYELPTDSEITIS